MNGRYESLTASVDDVRRAEAVDVRRWLERLSLPVTRRRVRGVARNVSVLRVIAWPAYTAATLPYIALRSAVDDIGMPRLGIAAGVDRVVGLGSTPTERLQDWLFVEELSAFDWLWAAAYFSWFFLPLLVTAYVLMFRWDKFLSLASFELALFYAPLVSFLLLPTEPPWMGTDATRMIYLTAAEPISLDGNPVAALPSLHVALPAALALWAHGEGFRRLTGLYVVQASLIAFAVVYLGEHYVVDVAAGVALAVFAVRWAGPWVERRARGGWMRLPRAVRAGASATANSPQPLH
jgi:membrane-associated phospholipid phosphatase